MASKRFIGFALGALTLLGLSGTAPAQVILPAEGAALNRLHIEFRWDTIPGVIGGYTLQIAEDSGAANPFIPWSGRVRAYFSKDQDPRMVVTRGLEFGKDYAWRVSAITGAPPGIRVLGPVHRFRTQDLPSNLPPIQIQTHPVQGQLQPGLTIFNVNRNYTTKGLMLAIESSGRVVMFQEFPAGVGDIRITPRGRLLVGLAPPVLNGPGGTGAEITLDGKLVWNSPVDTDAHHEAFELPSGNKLILTRLVQQLPHPWPSGPLADYRGDRIVEYDRHTQQEIWGWSTFDHYSPGDMGLNSFNMMPFGPSDWIHGNAAIYNEADGSVYLSARNLSRITRIDYATGQIVYNMGDEDLPAMDVDFGDNLFSNQHAPELLPNGNMLVYDNGNLREPLSNPRQSRAIELAFSGPPNAPTGAQIVWEYRLEANPGSPLFTPFVGDADRQPNGNTLVTAGRSAILDEVNANAELMWRMIISPPFPTHLIYRSERIAALIVDTPHDSDGDSDVDMVDMAEMQLAWTGAGPAGLAFPDSLLDHDADDDVDAVDLDRFAFWMTGPGH